MQVYVNVIVKFRYVSNLYRNTNVNMGMQREAHLDNNGAKKIER